VALAADTVRARIKMALRAMVSVNNLVTSYSFPEPLGPQKTGRDEKPAGSLQAQAPVS